ncbi:hypothetical protein STEG23_026436 [Scotinomys teguina]
MDIERCRKLKNRQVLTEGRGEEQMAQQGDIWGLEERKQLERRGLNAKLVKGLDDTGDLDGISTDTIVVLLALRFSILVSTYYNGADSWSRMIDFLFYIPPTAIPLHCLCTQKGLLVGILSSSVSFLEYLKTVQLILRLLPSLKLSSSLRVHQRKI